MFKIDLPPDSSWKWIDSEKCYHTADVQALVEAAKDEIKWRNDTTYNELKAALERIGEVDG